MKTLEELKNTCNLLIHNVTNDGGAGEIYRNGKPFATVVWSNGGGWEHVSMAPYNHRIVPSWDDMCKLKDMFFHDEETCVEYHPPKSQYVNMMSNCLHIWKPLLEKMPVPPSILVGLRDNQTVQDVR